MRRWWWLGLLAGSLAWAGPFELVPAGQSSYDQLAVLRRAGLLSGSGLDQPGAELTRFEFAQLWSVAYEALQHRLARAAATTGQPDPQVVSVAAAMAGLLTILSDELSQRSVDLPAAPAAGVRGLHPPGGNAVSVAEHTLAMMLSLARQVPAASASTLSGKWEKKKFLGNELRGKTLGVIGLGIDRLACAIGGSLGGMEAVELATTAPDRVARLVVVAASGRFHAQGIAYNEIQRRAIMLDPTWQGGDYGDTQPAGGVALARMVGMLTFQSDESMTMRFGRHPVARYNAWPEFQGRFDIEGYLHYQGDKLATRFDANAYLYLLRAMDSHDIGRERGGLAEAARLIAARTLVIGVRSDVLFPIVHVQATADAIARGGGAARYWELNSPHGHDAFLKDFHRLDAVLRDGIGQPESRQVTRLADEVETEAAD